MPETDPNSSKFSRILDFLLLITCLFVLSILLSLIFFCAYDPRAIIFLASWMPEEHYAYFPTGFLALIFHGYLMICLGFNLCISAGFLLIYLYSVTMFYTKELVLGQNHYATFKVLRSNPENLRKVFRAFQILNANLMCFLGMFIIYLHTVLMVVPIFGNFVLIKYWDRIHLIIKTSIGCTVCGALLFWTSVLQFGKYLWVRSNKILWSWKGVGWGSAKETRIMNKFRKSCKPVLLQNGNMIVIARMTQFKYMKGVVRGTFRSLLTLTGSLKHT